MGKLIAKKAVEAKAKAEAAKNQPVPIAEEPKPVVEEAAVPVSPEDEIKASQSQPEIEKAE